MSTYPHAHFPPPLYRFRDLIKLAVKGLNTFVNTVKKFAEDGLKKVGEFAQTIVDAAKKGIEIIIDSLRQIVEAIKKKLQAVKTWLLGIINAVKRAFESAIQGIKNIINQIKSAITKAWNFVKSLAGRLKKIVEDYVMKIYDFFNGLIKSAIKFATTIKNSVVKFAKDAFEKIKSLGAAIESVWVEIKKLPAMIVDLANKAVSEILKLLDYILKPLALSTSWSSIKSAAKASCAIFDVPVIVALCIAGQKMYRTIFGQVQDLVSKGVGLIFDKLGNLGSKAFSKPNALTFGKQAQAKVACVWVPRSFLPWNVMGAFMAYTACLVHARFLFGLEELIKLVFDVVLKEIENVILSSTKTAADLGSTKKPEMMVNLMGPRTLFRRVGLFGLYLQIQIKITVRLQWVLEGVLHWALDVVGKLIKPAGVDFGSRAAATAMSAWKHWVQFGACLGMTVRIYTTFLIRIYWGITSVLFHLASLVLKLCSLSPIPAPPTPEPACALAVASLKKLNSFIEELPVFVIGIACDMVLRLFRFWVGTVISVWDKVLDHLIRFLQGEGEIFDIAVTVMETIVEAIAGLFVDGAGADLFDILDGNIPKNLNFTNMKRPVSLFGLPPAVSQLGLELLVPCGSVGLKYMKATDLMAAFSFAGRSGLGEVKNHSKSTVGGVNMTLMTSVATNASNSNAVKSSTPAPAAVFLETAMRHGNGGNPNAFKSGSNLAMLGNGLGLGGPVEVRQSYGHKLMIHPRTMLPGFNNVNNNHNADELGMCVSRQFKLVKDAASLKVYTDIEDAVNTATADKVVAAKAALKVANAACEFKNVNALTADGVSVSPETVKCYLAFANEYKDLKNAWCGNRVGLNVKCTTDAQAFNAKTHYDIYYASGQGGGHRAGADTLAACLKPMWCYLAYANANKDDLQKAWCDSKKCTNTYQADRAKKHWGDWYPQASVGKTLNSADGKHWKSANELAICIKARTGLALTKFTMIAAGSSMQDDWNVLKTSQASRISYWIQEGGTRAFNCIASKGYTVGVDLVIDQGCGEGKGGPFTLNDMEWSFEGIDECHDTDVSADNLYQGLIKTLHKEIGPSAKLLGKWFVQEKMPFLKPVYRKVGKFLCDQHKKFAGGAETQNDLDDVEVTMRMCNMESLVMADNGSARPFFGVIEYSQFNNAIKRISFSEYGISFEFQTSIVGIFSPLGKLIKRASKNMKAKVKSVKTMKVGAFILEMINNMNLQVSLVRNKAGILEFMIDMTSLQNIPNIFQDASSENSLAAAAGAKKATVSYLFAFIAPRSADGSFERKFCFIGNCFNSKFPMIPASGAGFGTAARAITFSVMTYAFSLFAGRPIENDFSKSSFKGMSGKEKFKAAAREICTPSKEEKGECDTVKRICRDVRNAAAAKKATKKKAAEDKIHAKTEKDLLRRRGMHNQNEI